MGNNFDALCTHCGHLAIIKNIKTGYEECSYCGAIVKKLKKHEIETIIKTSSNIKKNLKIQSNTPFYTTSFATSTNSNNNKEKYNIFIYKIRTHFPYLVVLFCVLVIFIFREIAIFSV